MVQIIQENPRRSFGRQLLDNEEKIGSAFERLLSDKREKQVREESKRRRMAEDLAIKRETGVDISGIDDPKIRQELTDIHAKEKQRTNRLKELGILGYEEKQPSPLTDRFLQQDQTESNLPQQPRSNFSHLSDEQIMGLYEVDPRLGQLAERQKKQFIETQDKERERKEVEQIYRDAGMPADVAKQRAQTDSVATARNYFNRITEKPPFETESDKIEAKRSAEFADQIIKDYQAASDAAPRLDRQEELAKSGKLATPLLVKTLNTVGLPISTLTNPETEEYQKLENDFVKDVANYFPGQVRVYEAQTYMKTIPSLMNSDEGKKIVIRNLRLQNEAKMARYQAYKDIVKENGGRKPPNLDLQVFERIEPKMKELGEKFQRGITEDIEKYLPSITMYKDGRQFKIPQNKIAEASEQGFTFK